MNFSIEKINELFDTRKKWHVMSLSSGYSLILLGNEDGVNIYTIQQDEKNEIVSTIFSHQLKVGVCKFFRMNFDGSIFTCLCKCKEESFLNLKFYKVEELKKGSSDQFTSLKSTIDLENYHSHPSQNIFLIVSEKSAVLYKIKKDEIGKLAENTDMRTLSSGGFSTDGKLVVFCLQNNSIVLLDLNLCIVLIVEKPKEFIGTVEHVQFMDSTALSVLYKSQASDRNAKYTFYILNTDDGSSKSFADLFMDFRSSSDYLFTKKITKWNLSFYASTSARKLGCIVKDLNSKDDNFRLVTGPSIFSTAGSIVGLDVYKYVHPNTKLTEYYLCILYECNMSVWRVKNIPSIINDCSASSNLVDENYKDLEARMKRLEKNFNMHLKICGCQGKSKKILGKSIQDDPEDKDLYTQIEESIVAQKPNIKWSDIAGLKAAKNALIEAVIFPKKFPHFFNDTRRPWSAILFYGAPGTGKTLLAEAVATEMDHATFFSISSASLISKWQGESERLVRMLFHVAREKKPTVIFIDEIDALCSSRSDEDTETARRIKTEFLVQMQGLGNDNDGILVLAATNTPWVLDNAIRRRFQRLLYIPLPDEIARIAIFKLNMNKISNTLTDNDFKELARRTDHLSGSDISIVIQDSLMQPLRQVQTATHFKNINAPSISNPNSIVEDLLTPCSPDCIGAIKMSWLEVPGEKLYDPPISMNDVMLSLKKNKASIKETDLIKLQEFTREFGTEG